MILEYKNIPIYYRDQGQGREVVLLHGFLETSSMWEDLMATLETSHRVITIDLLGHGQTGCLGYIHTMEMMADAVVFVLEQLNVNNCYVIGHSMGGYVALALADAYPQKVYGLCLMNSTPFADSLERQINRDRAIKVVKQNPRGFIRMSIVNLFHPENKEQFVDEMESLVLESMDLPLQGIVAALEGMKIRKDRGEVFKKLKADKLIILGHKDPVLEFNNLDSELKKIGIKSQELPGGHMAHIENKKEFTFIIRRFVEN